MNHKIPNHGNLPLIHPPDHRLQNLESNLLSVAKECTRLTCTYICSDAVDDRAIINCDANDIGLLFYKYSLRKHCPNVNGADIRNVIEYQHENTRFCQKKRDSMTSATLCSAQAIIDTAKDVKNTFERIAVAPPYINLHLSATDKIEINNLYWTKYKTFCENNEAKVFE